MQLDVMNSVSTSGSSSYKNINGSKSNINGYPKENGIDDSKVNTSILPVRLVETDLINHLKENEVCIIIGETGSGKSTQIPQIILDNNIISNCDNSSSIDERENVIVVTQPRRLAARSLAQRVASERKCSLGDEVGYKFRFENQSSQKTRILYATDGILMNEASNDPFLKKYGMVIVDEAHERSLSTDMVLTLLQLLRRKKKERKSSLRIIIMSATMNADKFSKFFDNAKIFSIEGRSFETKLFYLPKPTLNDDRTICLCIDCVVQLDETEPREHGFLIFLPGTDEINSALKIMHEKQRSLGLKMYLMPLYSSLPTAKQNHIYNNYGQVRKVIFSTNIAETSVTIPGIRVVIDSGKVKQKEYLPQRKVDLLRVINVSKAQAIQRAGRAGREGPGKCYRLYSQSEYDKMKTTTEPEIMRTNLCSLLLTFYKLGMKRYKKLHYVDAPPEDQLREAVRDLERMKLIQECDGGHECTNEGNLIAQFPIDPMYGKILLRAAANGCLQEAITIVAFLSSDPVFTNDNDEKLTEARMRFNKNEGDHAKLLAIYKFFKDVRKQKKNGLKEDLHRYGLNEVRLVTVQKIRKQISDLCNSMELENRSCQQDLTPLRKALAEALPYNICIRDSDVKGYRLLKDSSVVCKIHPSSCVVRSNPYCIVFTTMVETNALYARDVTVIDQEWISNGDVK